MNDESTNGCLGHRGDNVSYNLDVPIESSTYYSTYYIILLLQGKIYEKIEYTIYVIGAK